MIWLFALHSILLADNAFFFILVIDTASRAQLEDSDQSGTTKSKDRIHWFSQSWNSISCNIDNVLLTKYIDLSRSVRVKQKYVRSQRNRFSHCVKLLSGIQCNA